MNGRLHFFDNLKSAVILLIVAFHCAMSFMKYAPEWWYVINNETAVPFTWFVIWADNFIMPVMFFISGFFGLRSLQKWKPADFWRMKLHRIALPWLAGMIFFVPYLIWLWFFSRDIPISIYELIAEQYTGPFYQQGVYWYLSALLALYFLLFLARLTFPRLFQPAPGSHSRSFKYLLAIYTGLTAISMFLLNLFYQDTTWINFGYVLVLQITRVPIYIASFFLGACCERANFFPPSFKGKAPLPAILPLTFIASSILFVYFRMAYAIESTWDI